jgi:hypothetical protein
MGSSRIPLYPWLGPFVLGGRIRGIQQVVHKLLSSALDFRGFLPPNAWSRLWSQTISQ